MEARDEILRDLKETGALMEGHFILSSGLHSPAYVQCARLLQYPELAEKYAKVLSLFYSPGEVDAVIGPALGGVVLGYETARQLNARAIFTERGDDGEMLLRRGFEIEPGERILVAEDVITTGKSTVEVIKIIREKEGVLAGVCSLIDRGAGEFSPGLEAASVVRLPIDSYPADSCPLCRKGVPPEKPGSRKSII